MADPHGGGAEELRKEQGNSSGEQDAAGAGQDV